MSIGGAVNTGGTLASGGIASTGGTISTGGAVATGGANIVGGTMSTGGQLSTGGTPNPSCGAPTTPKASCQNLTTQCQGESCCTSITIQAGSFQMGRSTNSAASDYYVGGGNDEIPEHTTTVPAYALDKYEVTVGRFRQFVMVYDQWHGTCGNPKLGDGAIPNIINTGWGQSWTLDNKELFANTNELKPYLVDSCDSPTYSVTDTTHDDYPINCVDWYEAFAFCLWDGGWLPTEAQWEYAAAGGGDAQGNRLYPWGNTAPNHKLANYYDASCATCPNSPYVPVGSTPDGNARWGHADMAGSMWEWVFDWYSSDFYGPTMNPTACSNCANSTEPSDTVRSDRGGDWESLYSDTSHLRAAARDPSRPDLHYQGLGFRCARPAE